MKYLNYIFLLFGLSFIVNATQAQNFEGKVVMMQYKGIEAPVQITWYIKGDKIAYDIVFETPEGQTMNLRCIPQVDKKQLRLKDIAGSFDYEVPVSSIEVETDLRSAVKVQTVAQARSLKSNYKTVSSLDVYHPSVSKTQVEYTTDIIVDWAKYSEFFLNDYAVVAMAKEQIKGFPVSSETKDDKGNVIFKTEVTSVSATKISDSIFE